MRGVSGVVSRLASIWSTRIPPHVYALLRIGFALVGLMRMAGMSSVELFWAADGIVPLPGGGTGLRQWVVDSGLGTIAGWTIYLYITTALFSMLLGYRSNLSVLASYLGLLLESQWNRLPLSSSHPAMTTMVFCLIWAETGRVWSLDARRNPQRESEDVAAWPLYLIRCQMAVIYFTSGLFKVLSPAWRDGSAIHWVLNLNSFHRFPWVPGPAVEPLLSLLTWGTLLFELAFPVLVMWRPTRTITVLAGIGLHLGMGVTLELGLFSWVMLAGYIAFLDPIRVPQLAQLLLRPVIKSNTPSAITKL